MLKRIAICISLASAVAPASAGNIYQPGSEGDVLYKKVQYLLPPEVVPLFIPLENRTRILKTMDYSAYSKEGLTVKTVSYFIDRMGKKLTASNGIAAYAMTGGKIPGNEKQRKFCGIVFTSVAALKDEGVLTHEAIHCKNAFMNGTDAYKNAANPAWQLSKKLTARQFMVMLDEATVGGIQVAYAYNFGKTAGLRMVQQYADHKQNGVVSIGYRTARRLLDLCGRRLSKL